MKVVSEPSGGRSLMRYRILFITWDGPQTQYLGRLFLPVFRELAAEGHTIFVLQFSSATKEIRADIRAQCQEEGIEYHPFPIAKELGMVGVLMSVAVGSAWLALRLLRGNFDAVLVRSIMPALIFLLAPLKSGARLVYDSDGLPVEQRLEFEGMRNDGVLHRVLKLVEKLILRRAVAVVSRSQFGSSVLRNRSGEDAGRKLFLEHNNGVGPISSSQGGKELDSQPGVTERNFTVAYVGSWGAQYEPTKMIKLVSAIRDAVPETKFAIFTGDDEAVKRDLQRHELSVADWVEVHQVSFTEVQDVLRECDVGLAFRSSSVTSDSVYPLKLADYLFAGLPIVGNQVGDMEHGLVNSEVFCDVESRDFPEIVDWCVNLLRSDRQGLRKDCVSLAERLYSLKRTTDVYRRALAHANSRPIDV